MGMGIGMGFAETRREVLAEDAEEDAEEDDAEDDEEEEEDCGGNGGATCLTTSLAVVSAEPRGVAAVAYPVDIPGPMLAVRRTGRC